MRRAPLLLTALLLTGCGAVGPTTPATVTAMPAPSTPAATETVAGTVAAVTSTLAVAPWPPPHRPAVALTFDDGPGRHTTQVLDILVEHDAVATFFVVGSEVDGRERTITELLDAGMGVQHHSWSHTDLTMLGPRGVGTEIERSAEVLEPLGAQLTCLRAPYGFTSAELGTVVAQHDLTLQGWNVDTRDWARPGAQAIAAAALEDLQDGDVILLHDGGGDRTQTLEALPQILDGLTEQGFATHLVCGA